MGKETTTQRVGQLAMNKRAPHVKIGGKHKGIRFTVDKDGNVVRHYKDGGAVCRGMGAAMGGGKFVGVK
jgi:hypothetical protein